MKKMTAFQAEILVKIARARGQRIRPYGLQIRTCKSLALRGLVMLMPDGWQITDAGRKAAEDLIRAMGETE